jgi:hypothetical protein
VPGLVMTGGSSRFGTAWAKTSVTRVAAVGVRGLPPHPVHDAGKVDWTTSATSPAFLKQYSRDRAPQRRALSAAIFTARFLDICSLLVHNPVGRDTHKMGMAMSAFRSLSSKDSAPAINARDCRTYCAQCMALGMQPNISVQRAAILSAMGRSWTTLANQMDRYEAVLQDECG